MNDEQFQRDLRHQSGFLLEHIARKIPDILKRILAPEDVLQQVWVNACRHYSTFRNNEDRSLKKWLITIADRIIIDEFRKHTCPKRGGHNGPMEKKNDLATSLFNLFVDVMEPCRSPGSELVAQEIAKEVQIALDQISEERRKVLIMRYVDDLPQEEIAHRMEKTIAAVNSLLYHGKLQLAKILKDSGSQIIIEWGQS
ncbi:MAG: RNA polymerase sigma factor [Phycisphaerales bacterium]|nr:RNA polymerase sigma factor [Phycisphaerales bacterium]